MTPIHLFFNHKGANMLRQLLLSSAVFLSAISYANDKIELILDWFINPDHAPLFVAQQQGIFAKHGLEVSIIEPSDPTLPPKLVAAGKADLAVSYQPQLHLHVDEGLPLSRIATLVATPLNTLIVLQDSGIERISDLKGKTIGYSVSGFEEVLLATMLQSDGLQPDDVELINIGWTLSSSLASGKVDAIFGGYRNFELTQLELEGHPGKAFYVEEHGVPPSDELIVIANNDSREDERFVRFNNALEEATQYLVNHPETAWQAFIANDSERDTELNRRAWIDTLPRFALRPGAMDNRRYQRMAEFLQSHGLLKNPLPAVSSYAIEP